MDVEGQTEVIPFLMIASNPTATKSIAIGLVVFLVVVRAIKIKRDRQRKQSAISVSKSVAVAVVLMLITLPHIAHAHHIDGMPHASVGPYDILMTSIPEKPVSGEATHITFYIIDSNTGRPIDQSITVHVLQTFTFRQNKEIVEPTIHLPINLQYPFKMVFPEDGEYLLELTLEVEGRTEIIPFLLFVGNSSATTLIVISIGVGLVTFLVIVRAVKAMRNRKRQRSVTNE